MLFLSGFCIYITGRDMATCPPRGSETGLLGLILVASDWELGADRESLREARNQHSSRGHVHGWRPH